MDCIEPNMLMFPTRKCKHSDCEEFATHGTRIRKQKYCADHTDKRKNNHFELCLKIDVLNDKGLCRMYDPGEHFKFRMKAHEEKVKRWLLGSDHNNLFRHDRSDPDFHKCFGHRYRPDFLFENPSHFTIVEVDEDQHKDKPYVCDLNRMVEISQSLGLPTIFIRFNPDQYTKDGVKYDPSDNERRKHLLKVLNWCRELVPPSYLSVIHLYYDGFVKEFKLTPIDVVELAKK